MRRLSFHVIAEPMAAARSLSPLSPFVERCAGETADAGEQQRDPQQHVVAVAGQRRADGLHEADLDGVGRIDVLEGVASGGADALAVDLDVCNGIAVIRRNGEGQILALTDADVAEGEMEPPSPATTLIT